MDYLELERSTYRDGGEILDRHEPQRRSVAGLFVDVEDGRGVEPAEEGCGLDPRAHEEAGGREPLSGWRHDVHIVQRRGQVARLTTPTRLPFGQRRSVTAQWP
jgi:hypothetical protein